MTSAVDTQHLCTCSSIVGGDVGIQRPSEVDVIRYLTDASLNKRDLILEQLRVWIQLSSGRRQLFADPVSVFHGIAAALTDAVWDTRYQAVRLVEELVPLMKPGDVERCLQVVLRPLVRCLGDPKMTVGMAAADTLDLCADRTGNFGELLESVARFGVLSDCPLTKKSVLANLSFLFTKKNANRDFQILVTALVSLLSEDISCGSNAEILRHLHKISALVGNVRFRSYLDATLPYLRDRYCELSKNSRPQSPVDAAAVSLDLVYGIIPEKIILQLADETDIRAQQQAAGELNEIVISTSDIHDLRPQLTPFLMFVAGLLQERVNFQVCNQATLCYRLRVIHF